MITIGICDDDARVLTQLETVIKEKFKDLFVETFSKPLELEEYLKNPNTRPIDIMIMDIVFENDNGIAAAKRIQQRYPKLPLIYLTGYIDYARDIFESDPIYFLVKPVKREKLFDAINRAIEKCDVKEYLTIKTKGELHRICMDDVLYIESEKRNIHIHTNKYNLTSVNQLSDIEEQLPSEFIRIHQSYMVNINYIEVFDATSVRLNTSEILPISRYRSKSAREKIMRYMGERV